MNDETDMDKKVYRSFALSLRTFDYLKQYQRDYQQRHSVLINNNQTLTLLLEEHQQLNEECGYRHERQQARLHSD